MVGGRLSSHPWSLSHGTKEAPHTSWRLDLGNALGDLTIERKLLEFGEQQVAKWIMQSHEFGLVISGTEVEVLILFQLRDKAKGKRSHLCHPLFALTTHCSLAT
jgi:hypothetical protein